MDTTLIPPSQSKSTGQALEVLNTARSAADIADQVGGAENAASILDLRARTGGFSGLDALRSHSAETRSGLQALLSGFEQPTLDVPQQQSYVMWAHAAGSQIEDAPSFRTERHPWGIEVSGYSFEEREAAVEDGSPLGYSQGLLYCAIPTPSNVDGQEFFLRSIILNYRGTEPAHGRQGEPYATIYEMQVHDGHREIFNDRLDYTFETNTHRYRRIALDYAARVDFGIGVTLRPMVINDRFSLTISAVGAEFATRKGPLVAPV